MVDARLPPLPPLTISSPSSNALELLAAFTPLVSEAAPTLLVTNLVRGCLVTDSRHCQAWQASINPGFVRLRKPLLTTYQGSTKAALRLYAGCNERVGKALVRARLSSEACHASPHTSRVTPLPSQLWRHSVARLL